jgi:hypothetical protein
MFGEEEATLIFLRHKTPGSQGRSGSMLGEQASGSTHFSLRPQVQWRKFLVSPLYRKKNLKVLRSHFCTKIGERRGLRIGMLKKDLRHEARD